MLTDRTWLWLASALYGAGFIMGTIALLREKRHSRAIMYTIIAAGLVLQTLGMYLRGQEVKGCPIGNTFEIFQFTAWSATVLYLLVGPTFRVSLLGYFTSCLAATMTLVSLVTPSWDATRRVGAFGGNHWIEFHAALAIFSYGVFGLLTLTSVMYLLQLRSLQKRKMRGVFSFLPSILDLDHIGVRLLQMGALLMTASIAVGAVYWAKDWSRVPVDKLSLTVAIWLSYVVTLALRLTGTLVGKRLAWTCVALFAVALLSLKVVNSSRKALPAGVPPAASAPPRA